MSDESTTVAEAEVWSLDTGNQRVSIAIAELAAVVYQPILYLLPQATNWCCRFVIWKGRVVPVVDLALRLGHKATSESDAAELAFLSVFAWDSASGVSTGGILTLQPPENIWIRDDMIHALPEPVDSWHEISRSCFAQEDDVIPILDLAAIFADVER